MLGKDYTKERIKERIEDPNKSRTSHPLAFYEKKSYKKPDTIVDVKNNEKVKSSKGYEIWAGKHNTRTMAASLNEIRRYGITSYEQLDQKLQEIASNRQKTLNEIKGIEKEMKGLYSAIENQHTLSQNKLVYDMYPENTEDTAFYEEYKPQIITYEMALKGLERSEYATASMQTLSEKYAVLEQEKNVLMNEYAAENSMLHELQQAKKNTDVYLDNSLEK